MLKINQFDYQIDEFLNSCLVKDLSKKTMRSYEQTLRLLSKYLCNNYQVEDAAKVKEQMLIRYISYLKERGKYTEVFDDKTKNINHPDNRSDFGIKISTTTIIIT